jgi:hypothetical protein
MDLIARVRRRKKEKEQKKLRKMVEEEVLRKTPKVYTPTSKKLTIILFILLLVVVPYIYLNSESIIRSSCGLIPGYECKNLQLTPMKISFEVHNMLKEDHNITIRIEGCAHQENHYVRKNEMAVFSFDCAMHEKTARREIYLTYVGYSGLPHDKTGHLVGKVKR